MNEGSIGGFQWRTVPQGTAVDLRCKNLPVGKSGNRVAARNSAWDDEKLSFYGFMATD